MKVCPWCSQEITIEYDTYHLGGECIGNTYNQHPHPFSREWCDPDWRETWLNGMSDDELEECSPERLRSILPQYVLCFTLNQDPMHLYGEHALAWKNLCREWKKVEKQQHQTNQEPTMSYLEYQRYMEGIELIKEALSKRKSVNG